MRLRTPRRMRRGTTLLVALASIALGCSGDPESPAATSQATQVEPDIEFDVESDGESDGESGQDEAAPEGFEPPARPSPAPDIQLPGSCDAMTTAAIGAVVSAQLEAFTHDDLDAAYALTSPFFQRVLDRDAFDSMIRTDYPYLLESSGHRLDECWTRNGRGYILAGVRVGTREVVLRYDVSDEPDVGWRIDGAAEVPGIRLPDDQLV